MLFEQLFLGQLIEQPIKLHHIHGESGKNAEA